MIKYKNWLLVILLIISGVILIINNFNFSNKTSIKNKNYSENVNLNNILLRKQKYFYLIESNSQANITNYCINRVNTLNRILLVSEENIFGFKNLYSLASTPHKIIEWKKQINKLKQKKKNELIKIKNQLRCIELSLTYNKLINYSNYRNNINNNLFSLKSMTNSLSNNNLKPFIKVFKKVELTRKKNNISVIIKSWVYKNWFYILPSIPLTVLGIALSATVCYCVVIIVYRWHSWNKIQAKLTTRNNYFKRIINITNNNNVSSDIIKNGTLTNAAERDKIQVGPFDTTDIIRVQSEEFDKISSVDNSTFVKLTSRKVKKYAAKIKKDTSEDLKFLDIENYTPKII